MEAKSFPRHGPFAQYSSWVPVCKRIYRPVGIDVRVLRCGLVVYSISLIVCQRVAHWSLFSVNLITTFWEDFYFKTYDNYIIYLEISIGYTRLLSGGWIATLFSHWTTVHEIIGIASTPTQHATTFAIVKEWKNEIIMILIIIMLTHHSYNIKHNRQHHRKAKGIEC